MKENQERLLAFLKKYFVVDKVDGDTNIYEMGFVNSLFSMQMIMFLEREFNITVDTNDMDIQNFNTINNMLKFIEGKQSNN